MVAVARYLRRHLPAAFRAKSKSRWLAKAGYGKPATFSSVAISVGHLWHFIKHRCHGGERGEEVEGWRRSEKSRWKCGAAPRKVDSLRGGPRNPALAGAVAAAPLRTRAVRAGISSRPGAPRRSFNIGRGPRCDASAGWYARVSFARQRKMRSVDAACSLTSPRRLRRERSATRRDADARIRSEACRAAARQVVALDPRSPLGCERRNVLVVKKWRLFLCNDEYTRYMREK